MPLEEDLVASSGCVRTAEEVIEADLVERRRRRVCGDVTADANPGTLRAVHHDRGVPADELADAALECLVAGEPRLHLGRDRVDVVRRSEARDAEIALSSSAQECKHEVARSIGTGTVDDLVQGGRPLGRLLGVDVDVLGGQATSEQGLLAERVEAG